MTSSRLPRTNTGVSATTSLKPGARSRAVAARIIHAVVYRKRSLKSEFDVHLPALSDTRDRALVEAICMGALRQRHRYQNALKHWLPNGLKRKDEIIGALLLAGFAQLDVLKLPVHAVLSATVDAAKALQRSRQAGWVNAVLRRAQREGFPSLGAEMAWPAWLRRQIADDWPQYEKRIFEASLQPPPLWLRINRQKTSVSDYQERLARCGVTTVAIPELPDALYLEEPIPIAQLIGFSEGEVSIQDGSAQQVADAVTLPPRARLLDACAAPGGKAAHLLEREPSLQLVALDKDARRLSRINGTFSRLGLGTDARLQAADATQLTDWWNGEPFDAVLLDAPCSATGIVRRQPDVLLHKRPQDIDALVMAQARLLDALWNTIRPGGIMLYSTCSILKKENASQIDRFLQRTADSRLDPLPLTFGHPTTSGNQRLPGEANRDGFFYARLRKIPR